MNKTETLYGQAKLLDFRTSGAYCHIFSATS